MLLALPSWYHAHIACSIFLRLQESSSHCHYVGRVRNVPESGGARHISKGAIFLTRRQCRFDTYRNRLLWSAEHVHLPAGQRAILMIAEAVGQHAVTRVKSTQYARPYQAGWRMSCKNVCRQDCSRCVSCQIHGLQAMIKGEVRSQAIQPNDLNKVVQFELNGWVIHLHTIYMLPD